MSQLEDNYLTRNVSFLPWFFYSLQTAWNYTLIIPIILSNIFNNHNGTNFNTYLSKIFYCSALYILSLKFHYVSLSIHDDFLINQYSSTHRHNGNIQNFFLLAVCWIVSQPTFLKLIQNDIHFEACCNWIVYSRANNVGNEII